VPHEDDDESLLVPPDGFVHELLAEIDAVPRARGAEAKILPEDRGIAVGGVVDAPELGSADQGRGMLADEGLLARDVVEVLEELDRLG
jgi:hypothetical protein